MASISDSSRKLLIQEGEIGPDVDYLHLGPGKAAAQFREQELLEILHIPAVVLSRQDGPVLFHEQVREEGLHLPFSVISS